ncbi:hypothetical protein Tco_0177244, partial [Tanacetum coccineum]
ANTTPIVATVMKPATKEKTPKDADATPRVDIQDFCEEHYEDILLVIMDKIRCDNRKEVHARLDFKESPKKRRIREGSQNSSAKTLSARYRNPSERLKVWDRLRYNDRHVLDRLGQTPWIVPIVEVVLTGGTLLTEIVLGAETAPAASKNHMIILAPPTEWGPEPAMEDAGSQSQKGISLRMRMTWRCPGYVKRWIRLHLEFAISKVHEKHKCLTT